MSVLVLLVLLASMFKMFYILFVHVLVKRFYFQKIILSNNILESF
jgi:hypothetical protein